MDINIFYKKLNQIIPDVVFLLNEPMKNHTSFRIGGPADLIIFPNSERQIMETIKLAKSQSIPYYIIGNGTNLLVRDSGIRGIVIQINDKFNRINVDGHFIEAQAGTLLSAVSRRAVKEGLKGLEFASGIPGTVGGGVVMNAGAYGGEMKDVVYSVSVIDENGQIKELKNDELKLGYRSSIIKEKNYIVVNVKFKLENGNINESTMVINELTKKRKEKQPLNYPSAGSVFKRPTGYYAGKLIQDAGLKGFTVGGAQVSELHSGFIINKDNATADDVLNLIKIIQQKVDEKFNVHLTPEIKIIGEE